MSRRYSMSEFTRKIDGQNIEINVGSDGVFGARFSGDYFKSETLKDLLVQLRKAVKKLKIRVEIPATLMNYHINEGSQWNPKYSKFQDIPVLIVGMSPRGVMLEKEDGVKIEHERFTARERDLFKRMSEFEVKQYRTLQKASEDSEKAFDAFVKKWKIDDVDALVKKEIAKKADEVIEPDDDESEDPR